MLGNLYYRSSNYNEAIKYYLSALSKAESLVDRLGTANRFNNLGNAYTHIGDSEEAIKYLTEARKVFLEIGNEQWVNNVDKLIEYNQNPLSLPRRLISRLLNTLPTIR